MGRHITRTVVALCAGALLASGCSAGSGSDDAPGKGQGGTSSEDLVVGLVAEPASLDFTKKDGAAIPQALLYNVYESLVKLDGKGEIVPALAKSWELSEDRTTYTFELVKGAEFTNGDPMTADDVVFSIDRVKSDWTISLKSALNAVKSAKALSPTKVEVTLKQPSNSWLYSMTTRVGAIFSEKGVDKLATSPVGTGPYEFATWKRGSSITLKRNEDYWGDKPYFQSVTLRYFDDATALNNALLTDTIDVVGTVQAPESLKQFSRDEYQVIEGTTNGEVVLSFNNGRAPFDDLRVRQAARHAIDHKALLKTCWAGRGTLIGSMVPPTDPWYEDRTGDYPHDAGKARSLLKEAGNKGVEVKLRVPNLPYATSCGQVVKSQLEEAGFTVELEQLEFPAAWLSKVFENADYDMSIVAHVEPRDMAAVFGNQDYYTRYDNPELRKELAAADTGTEQEQIRHMKKAARILSEDAAADFLFLMPNLIVAEKGITGLPRNAVSESFDLSRLARS